jgi:uncharacterized protein (DUF427 family)
MAQASPDVIRSRDPNHTVAVEPGSQQVRVTLNGETIADSRRIKVLHEAGHRPTFYFPQEDVSMNLLTPTDHHTHCPYKGEASYWTIEAGDRVSENAVWGYLDPYPEQESITGYLAFYANRVDAIFVDGDEQPRPAPR